MRARGLTDTAARRACASMAVELGRVELARVALGARLRSRCKLRSVRGRAADDMTMRSAGRCCESPRLARTNCDGMIFHCRFQKVHIKIEKGQANSPASASSCLKALQAVKNPVF